MTNFSKNPSLLFYVKLINMFVNVFFFYYYYYSGEDYLAKADYVKIAPRITPMLKTHQGMNSLFIKIFINNI